MTISCSSRVARQIGKSFIIRETSKKFRNYVEINLQDDFDGEKIFSQIKTIKDFYFTVTSLYGDKMNDVQDTIYMIMFL